MPNPAILPGVFLLASNPAILLNLFLLVPNPAVLAGNWTWTSQVLQICKKQLDWAPAETRPAKLLDWAPAETIQFELLENSRPPACYFQGNSRKLGSIHNSSYWKIAGRRPSASSLLFSGELLETRGIHNSSYWKIAGLRPAIFRGTDWNFHA